ncbi:MAG TPA: DUF2059 domain-containing protein [Candidatus Sulfotelmatobacter sp.]|nr:DUF2059 domain-containing protein [Candidatus Sulfotelmatobacter sp.]
MKLKVWLCACVISVSASACAQTTVSIAPDAASKEDVQKLFDVMASRDQVRQLMQQMFAQVRAINRQEMKKKYPDITEEEIARAERGSEELIRNFPIDGMLSDMVPVYQRHFTKTEIDGLTAFYSSPVGQKFLHEMPSVTAETMQAAMPRIQATVDAALKRVDQKPESNKK